MPNAIAAEATAPGTFQGETAGIVTLPRVKGTTIALGLFAIVAWISLFAAGLVVDSNPYREAVSSMNGLTLGMRLYYWILVVATYTMTNVFLLCCLASVVGEIAERLRFELSAGDAASPVDGQSLLAALARGFFVYIVAISGVMMFVESPFKAATTLEQYVRLAGSISVVSFLMGCKPAMFSALLERIAKMLEGPRTGR